MMLTRDELEEYRTFRDPYLTEKDYLQELILREAYSDWGQAASLIFKGGTALSKFYYSGRFSEDLDFTFVGTADELKSVVKSMEGMPRRLFYETSFVSEPAANKFGTINAELGIKGPRYAGRESTLQHIKLEINTMSQALRRPSQLPRTPLYADVAGYMGTVMAKEEILSEKFRAIMSKTRRHRERDLYDMCFLLAKGIVPDMEEVSKKLDEAGTLFSKEVLLEAIEGVSSSWKDLEPFVGGRLESYDSARERTVGFLQRFGIF